MSVVPGAPTEKTTPVAEIVGNAFVHQYYLILHQSPGHVFRFYQDVSKLGRPEENGVMGTTTTMQAINDKILSLHYGDFKAEITTIDAQESHNGGFLVLVTGFLTGKDDLKRKFTQTFFLAPQEIGYFVLNDVFRFIDDAKYVDGNQGSINYSKAPIVPENDASPANESHIDEKTDSSAKEVEVNEEEVYNPTVNEDRSINIEEKEFLLPEVVDEIPDASQIPVETNPKIEELPKKSYASIVKVSKAVPVSAPARSPVKSVVKIQEQPTAAAPSIPLASAADTQDSKANVQENGNNQDRSEGPSIYVKGLPSSATETMLENEFKKFGPIRSDGIQVRSQKGFCFGFVEFEDASAVQSAIEASPVIISGKKVVVEEKRSTRGNSRARSSAGSGSGYRNEGARGRGNYGGGRGYNRGDFGNRSEFGNRNGNRGGGYSNREGDGYQRDRGEGYQRERGDGYQRSDQVGSNGGRVNRGGGFAVNGAPKNVAPRVSASA